MLLMTLGISAVSGFMVGKILRIKSIFGDNTHKDKLFTDAEIL